MLFLVVGMLLGLWLGWLCAQAYWVRLMKRLTAEMHSSLHREFTR
mgnify:FL=1